MKRLFALLALLAAPAFAANVTIADLDARVTIEATDLFECEDVSPAGTYKCTLTEIGTHILLGNAATATALAANGTNCDPGETPLGSDASGNAEGCYELAETDISDLAHLATDITAGIITEGDLDEDSGTPTDEDVLTYDSTGTNFNWVAQSGLVAGSASDLTCTDCINATEIEDVYVLNSGDYIGGDLRLDDGSTSSPILIFYPETGTPWGIYGDDSTGDLQIYSTTASTETVDIYNAGAGVTDLTVDGTTTTDGLAVTTTLALPDDSITADDIVSAGQVDGEVLTWSTGDILSWEAGGAAEVNDLEGTAPTAILDTEILIGTGSGTAAFAPMSGDATMANTGAVSLAESSVGLAEMNDEDHGDVAWIASQAKVTDVTCTDCINATEIEDIYTLTAGDTITGLTLVDLDSDEEALILQGHTTQLDDLFIIEQSDGTDVLNVDNDGNLTIAGDLATAAVANPQLVLDDSDSASETDDARFYTNATTTTAAAEDADWWIASQVNSTEQAWITADADDGPTGGDPQLTLGFASLDALTVTTDSTGDGEVVLPADSIGDAEVSDTLTASVFKGSGTTTDAIDLATAEVAGNLPVANLNSGTAADATTYWRGDGTWVTPAGAGTVTDVWDCATGDCNTLTIGESEYLIGGAVDGTTDPYISLPQGTDCSTVTGEGRVCWDSDGDALYVGDGATASLISGGSGDNVKIDTVAVVDPDFQSTADIDFIDTSNVVTADINNDVVDYFHVYHGATPTSNPNLGLNDVYFGQSGLIFEGTVDDIELGLTTEDPTTVDKVVIIQNADHTIVGRDTTDTLTNKTIDATNAVTINASDITDLSANSDITADLEEEAHASEHSDAGTDEITAENLATACTDAQFLSGDGLGGLECEAPAGGFSNFDITDTDATPILTVDDGEQIQYIGAGTVTVVAAADGANHDVTITGSAHDGTGTDDQNLSVTAGGADTSVIDIEDGTDVTISGGTLTNVTEAASTITIEAVATLSSYTDDLSHVEESTTVTDSDNGLDIVKTTYDLTVALDPSEVAEQAGDLADIVPYEDVTDGGIHHMTFTQVQTLVADGTGTDDQTAAEVTFTPDDNGEWGTPPAEVDAALEDLAPRVTANDAKVTESTTVTDNADGMDITLSTYDIAVALDPSEVLNQAPDLADLVPYEDVTDGGIHHATLTQVQTLVDTTSVETAADITMGGDISSTANTAQVDDVQSATTNLEAANNDTTQVASTSFVQQEINGAGGTNLTCATGTCNVDDAFLLLAGDSSSGAYTLTGDWDFSGGGIEIENGTTPPACTEGQLYLDTDATAGQQLMACDAGTFVVQGDGGGAPGADSILIDTVAVENPDFQSTADIDFIDTSNVVTADINNAVVDYFHIYSSRTPTSNPPFGANKAFFGSAGLIFEGSTADDIELGLTVEDPTTSDKVVYIQDADHTLVGRDTTDTLTNKTIDATNNVTINAADISDLNVNDGDFCQGNASSGFDCDVTTIPAVDGGTGQNSSGSTGVPVVNAGTWSFDADPVDLAGVTTVTDGSFCQGATANGFDCDVLQTAIPGTGHIDASAEISADVVTTGHLDDDTDTPAEGEIVSVGQTTTEVRYLRPPPVVKTLFDTGNITTSDDVNHLHLWGDAVDVKEVKCMTSGGTSATITLDDGTNTLLSGCACATTLTTCGSLTNTTFTDDEQLDLDITAVSGSVTTLTIKIEWAYDN